MALSAKAGQGAVGKLVFAAAVLAAGAALRFAHVTQHYSHPDEPIALAVAAHASPANGFDTNWAHTSVGTRFGPAQFNFSTYHLVTGLVASVLRWDPRLDLSRIRALSALWSVAALALLMAVAWRALSWEVALCAGLWLALNPLMIQDGHYARADSFFTLLAVALLGLCLWRKNPPWAPLATGAVFGLMAACKVTAVLWIWMPFMVCWPEEETGKARRGAAVAMAALGIALGFAAGAPGVLANPRGFLEGVGYLDSQYSASIGPYSQAGGGAVALLVLRYLNETMGFWVLPLWAVGLGFAAARRQLRIVAAVYLPVAAVLGFLCSRAVFMERNLSHAVPFLLVGAAMGLVSACRWATRSRFGVWPAAVLAGAAALLPGELSWRLVSEGFSGTYETRVREAQARILTSIPFERPVAVYSLLANQADIALHFQVLWNQSGGPYLVLWHDVNETFSDESLRQIGTRFSIREIARIPGLFSDLRGPNSLRDYLQPSLRVLLVYRVKSGPAAPTSSGE